MSGSVADASPSTGHDLLLLEYERSSEFCNHVDNVRNVITSFFLTIVGAAAFMIDRFSSGDLKDGPLGHPAVRLAALLYAVAFVGILFVLVVGRLRRVQLERYMVMNSILDRVLQGATRGVIPFRNSGIAGRSGAGALGKRSTGSYFWTLIIVLPAASLAGLSTSVLISGSTSLGWFAVFSGVGAGLLYGLICDYGYFRASR